MAPRIALSRRRTSPLDTLLSPIKKMVAWGEPWDVEDDDDTPSPTATAPPPPRPNFER